MIGATSHLAFDTKWSFVHHWRLPFGMVGQFTEYEEDCSLGKELYAALADLVKEYDYPVCFNFPVGHVTHNLPLINGAKVEFTVGKKNVELKFIC